MSLIGCASQVLDHAVVGVDDILRHARAVDRLGVAQPDQGAVDHAHMRPALRVQDMLQIDGGGELEALGDVELTAADALLAGGVHQVVVEALVVRIRKQTALKDPQTRLPDAPTARRAPLGGATARPSSWQAARSGRVLLKDCRRLFTRRAEATYCVQCRHRPSPTPVPKPGPPTPPLLFQYPSVAQYIVAAVVKSPQRPMTATSASTDGASSVASQIKYLLLSIGHPCNAGCSAKK